MAEELTINGNLTGTLSAVGSVSGAVSKFNGEYPTYTGAYEVTPTEEEQVLSTTSRTLTADIVVNPIPNNYGLITWDGTAITVS